MHGHKLLPQVGVVARMITEGVIFSSCILTSSCLPMADGARSKDLPQEGLQVFEPKASA